MRPFPRAFTLVELMVVMGIIVLLAGLTLSVGSAIVEQSERRQTAALLKLLDTATQEWELASDRKLTWWDPIHDEQDTRSRAEVHGDTSDVLIITEILDVIGRTGSAQSILARIDPAFVYTYDASAWPDWIDSPQARAQVENRFAGSVTILDAWGKPIYATHPGRPVLPADYEHANEYGYSLHPDDDGTIRTYNEVNYGIAPNRRVVYVSAGPDGLFGLEAEFLELNGQEQKRAQSKARQDNVYSAPVTFRIPY